MVLAANELQYMLGWVGGRGRGVGRSDTVGLVSVAAECVTTNLVASSNTPSLALSSGCHSPSLVWPAFLHRVSQADIKVFARLCSSPDLEGHSIAHSVVTEFSSCGYSTEVPVSMLAVSRGPLPGTSGCTIILAG